jgi:putative Mn2+ efflux pump MntP
MLGLILVAGAVDLSNFAAPIGIGLSGVDAGVRIRVVVNFGIFEAAMPVLGLLIGHRLAASFGSEASYVGGGLLIAAGAFAIVQAKLSRPERAPVAIGTGRLIVSGAALSIENPGSRIRIWDLQGVGLQNVDRDTVCHGDVAI